MTVTAPIGPAVAPHPDPAVDHALSRRGIFYPKADLDVPDAVLRSLAQPDAAALRANGEHARALLARTLRLDAAGVRIEALARQGTFHHAFEGAPEARAPAHVVRVNRLPAHFVDWQLQAEAMLAAVLAAQGVPRARVVEVDCTRRRMPTDAQVVERIAGTSLAALDDDDAALAPWLARLATLLRRVHAIDGHGFGFVDVSNGARLAGVHAGWDEYLFTRLAQHLAALQASGAMTAAEAAIAQEEFDRARPALARLEPRLLHGDPGNHNAIGREGGDVLLVDWEDALLGDPLFDVAFWATFHPERRWPAFFDAYFGAGWTPSRRFWLYFLRVALSKTVHRQRFAYADRPGRPPAAARIQRALAGLHATRGQPL